MLKQSPYSLTQNPFTLIENQWAMITTRVGDKVNTMTANWGGVGILWYKPVVYLVVRPQRFTHEQLEQSERFSVCFLPEEYRKQATYCGKISGRDQDKLAVCGFDTIDLDGAPVLAQSELVFTCRKVLSQQFDSKAILDETVLKSVYHGNDFHFLYVGEILGTYQQEV